MSFGRFPGFDDDPFFSRDVPSYSMGFPSFPMLGFPGYDLHRERQRRDREQREHQAHRGRQLSLMDPFSMFNDMEKRMSEAFRQQERMLSGQHEEGGGGGGGAYFSSSSVMHYSSSKDKDGNPQVYHATSSVTKGPGGVKETRKSESDSSTGMKKMAIGHHIGERSHTIEKRENTRTKDLEQHQEFVNMDESDAANFDHEWQSKTKQFRHQPSLRGDYAHRRGLGGGAQLPDISGARPPHSQRGHHSSRSPERPHQRHAPYHAPLYSESEAERRKEYLKERREKQVRF